MIWKKWLQMTLGDIVTCARASRLAYLMENTML
jgi:hypothetical protein